jgi:hypothetical protein
MDRTSRGPRVVVLTATAGLIPDQAPANDNGRPWRCTECGALLGFARDGKVHIKYKDGSWAAHGGCDCTCRRCGAENTISLADVDDNANANGEA